MEVISYYARNHTGSISLDYKVAFRSQKDKLNCLLNIEKRDVFAQDVHITLRSIMLRRRRVRDVQNNENLRRISRYHA